jgi:DNA-binding MarR family transcriptional regulator
MAASRERLVFLAWLNLVQAAGVVAAVCETSLRAATGLSLAEHEVLARLEQAGGPLRMQAVADRLLVSKSGVTRLVDRLVEAGLVAREPSAADRRVVHAALTAEGRRTLVASMPVLMAGVEEALGRHVDATDLAELRRILGKVLAGNGAWEEERCAPAEVPAAG